MGDSVALLRCMGCKYLGHLGMITNFGGNHDFGMVLCSGLFWLFCCTNGHFLDFVILGDTITLPRCMDFYSLGGLGVS